MSRTKEMQDVLNAVYQGAVKECEEREHNGGRIGNGHHMAQKIVDNVEKELIRRNMFPETPTKSSDATPADPPVPTA